MCVCVYAYTYIHKHIYVYQYISICTYHVCRAGLRTLPGGVLEDEPRHAAEEVLEGEHVVKDAEGPDHVRACTNTKNG